MGFRPVAVLTKRMPEYRTIFKGEFKKGREACAKILLGAAKWESLWEPLPFFQMHKHYLQAGRALY